MILFATVGSFVDSLSPSTATSASRVSSRAMSGKPRRYAVWYAPIYPSPFSSERSPHAGTTRNARIAHNLTASSCNVTEAQVRPAGGSLSSIGGSRPCWSHLRSAFFHGGGSAGCEGVKTCRSAGRGVPTARVIPIRGLTHESPRQALVDLHCDKKPSQAHRRGARAHRRTIDWRDRGRGRRRCREARPRVARDESGGIDRRRRGLLG